MARSKQAEIKRKNDLLGTLKKRNALAKEAGETGKKTRIFKRWRPGTVAGRQVRKAMREVGPLVPRNQVYNIAREISASLGTTMRFQSEAIDALREAITAFGVDLMNYSNKTRMILGKELTLDTKHMQIGRALMGVPCLNDTSEPMYKKFAKEKKTMKAPQIKMTVEENEGADSE